MAPGDPGNPLLTSGETGALAPANHDQFVFNLVWTGEVFDRLSIFTASLLGHCGARFRFVANACPPSQIAAMERFAALHPGRVIEVMNVSPVEMVRHGDALDEVLRTRDDGEYFCFIDPDILARGPFLDDFCGHLVHHDAITSGKEIWSDENTRPAGHPGVNGEYFFDQDGFVFGSPHLAMYRRGPLTTTMHRWGVGFSSAGNDIPGETRARLEEVGRDFWIYDTGKIVNILFQGDGHSLVHAEHPELIHIGGVSHYLAPPTSQNSVGETWGRERDDGWLDEPSWATWDGMAPRFQVSSFTASVLSNLEAGHPAPDVPAGLEAGMDHKLRLVRIAVVELVNRFGTNSPRSSEGLR